MDEMETVSQETEPKKKKNKKIRWFWGVMVLLILVLGAYDGQLMGFWQILPAREAPAPAPTEATPAPAAAPTATPAPLFHPVEGYMYCRDGMFYPESPLTRGEAIAALESAGRTVSTRGEENVPLTEEALLTLAAENSDRTAAENAMASIRGLGDLTVTRSEGAVFFNRLFGLAPAGEEIGYFPDVAPDYWAWADIQTAASSGYYWPGNHGRLEEGFAMLNGYLYLADGDGYFKKNGFEGSLFFGPTGRYTSGSRELDDYVAAMLRDVTTAAMTREEMLQAAYNYVRDTFTYLTRHYYHIGDQGWALQEALTMYSTGKGNCYCFASAFWAAARQLGYDATIVSGTYGDNEAPHGWVEIFQPDGTRLTYDVEIEWRRIADHERGNISMFAMSDNYRRAHGYIEASVKDDLVPRETNEGLLPG